MGRPRRIDAAGMWHHVWNRAIASKPIFEGAADMRRFLAAVARAVHRGDIEIHAFVIMTTHFHLLIRSLRGTLSEAMARVLSDFTRYYNRSRVRDGTVWRGRFCSKPVHSYRYRATLLRYIDQNPVVAGMAAAPWEYEHGSAKRFVEGTCGWLSRSWVDVEIRICTGRTPADGGRYEDLFSITHAPAIARLVEARQSANPAGEDPLDSLLAAAPEGVRRWMEERSMLADGRKPGYPIVDAQSVLDRIARHEQLHGEIDVPTGGRSRSGPRILRVALLRDLSGETYGQTAARLGISRPCAFETYVDHGRLLASNPPYADLVTGLTLALLADLQTCLARL